MDGPDVYRTCRCRRFPVGIHGVAGEVQSCDLPLLTHQLLRGVFREVRHGHLCVPPGGGRRGYAEKVHLSLHILPPGAADGVHELVAHRHHLAAACAEAVEGPGADEVFQRPLVDVAVVQPFAEVLEPGKGTIFLPFPDHALNKAPANVFDCRQSEPDAALLYGKAVQGAVHVRRQQGYAHVPALGDIPGHFFRVAQHRRQQGRHIFAGVVIFEPGRLIGDHRVTDCMGLVESVIGKVIDFVINGLRGVSRDAVCNTTGNISV